MYTQTYNDGGRSAAYDKALELGFWDDVTKYKGSVNDCFTRAMAIVTGKPYAEVWHELKKMMRRGWAIDTPNHGVIIDYEVKQWAAALGYEYFDLRESYDIYKERSKRPALKDVKLPAKAVVLLKDHAVAVIDGVMQDTFNPTPSCKAHVSGYFAPVVKSSLWNVISEAGGKMNIAPLNLQQAQTMQRLLKNSYNRITTLKENG